jgi:hypothetical protein
VRGDFATSVRNDLPGPSIQPDGLAALSRRRPHEVFDTIAPARRVKYGRRAVSIGSGLVWNTRVLSAAAEVAESHIEPAHREVVARALADACSEVVAELSAVRGLLLAVRDALEAADLGDEVPAYEM